LEFGIYLLFGACILGFYMVNIYDNAFK